MAAAAAPAPTTATAPAAAAAAATASTDGKAAPHVPFPMEAVKDVVSRYRSEFDRVRQALREHKDNPATAPGGALTEPDDIQIFRFLRGYKYDITATTNALLLTLAWRRKYKMDEMGKVAANEKQSDFPFADKLHRTFAHAITHKTDKFGQPITIERMGRSKPDLMTKIISVNELRMYHLHHMEHKRAELAALTASTGKVARLCKIMDVDGLGTKHLEVNALKYFKLVMAISQTHYPESLGSLWVVNVPWIFKVIYAIVRPWINEETQSKIKICGADWQTELHKAVDPANLPKFLGGCCDCKGGCVLEIDADDGYTLQPIKAGARFSHSVVVGESDGKDGGASPVGSMLSYEFRTRSHDIGFSVKFAVKTGVKVTSNALKGCDRAYAKVASDKSIQSGMIEVVCPGTFTFEWDNSYSYWTAKDLLFRTDILKPTAVDAVATAAHQTSPAAAPATAPASPTIQLAGAPSLPALGALPPTAATATATAAAPAS